MPRDKPKEASELIPARPTLAAVRAAAQVCQACALWTRGTQTVFGEGARRAELMLIGEQPGNDEDLSGHPFVGPAGKLLDRALEEAGIDRTAISCTRVKYWSRLLEKLGEHLGPLEGQGERPADAVRMK